MKIFTNINRKGGVGKTTSALNLVRAFSEMKKRVLLVDLDDQKNTTNAIEASAKTNETIGSLLLEEKIRVCDVAVHTKWEGVDLIASSGNLSGVIRELDSEIGSHQVLREKLLKTDDYDICIIDTSPSLNILVVNALCASDFMFIPLSSKYFSLQGLAQTLEAYKKIHSRQLNKNLKIAGMAFVIHDARSNLAREVIEKVKSEYPQYLLETVITQNIKIEEAQIQKQSVLDYAPSDKGAVQYRILAAELACRIGV
ncbi:MAG: ParA family protein [Termitinemataceae bacterium]|nr:MAG: ParA family protein [Termitinemataceae bacterium]